MGQKLLAYLCICSRGHLKHKGTDALQLKKKAYKLFITYLFDQI